MITFINTSSTRENRESVLFQPVLKAYPTHYFWLITAHISLGNLEQHWKSFTRQMDRTWQLLQSLSHWPSAPTHMVSALQIELTNLNDIYTSHKPIIIMAINLLNTEPSFSGTSNYNKCAIRSLLPFLGDALSWLTGTTTTKDITSIKKRVNQLITAQTAQETIVHSVSILNVTRYTAQVNRQHINIVMDAVDKMVQDVNKLYNITTSLYTSLSYHQLLLHIRSILANLWDFLILYKNSFHAYNGLCWCSHYQNTFASHLTNCRTLDRCYCTLRKTLSPTMHLPVWSEDTLHFYQIPPCTHAFWLPIDSSCYSSGVPVQDRMHNNFGVCRIFYFGHSSCKFHSTMWWHTHQIPWSNTGWNYGSRNCHNISSEHVKKPVDNFAMLMHSSSTPCQPSILHHSPIHRGCSQYYQLDAHYRSERLKVSAYPSSIASKCMDTDFSILLQWPLE